MKNYRSQAKSKEHVKDILREMIALFSGKELHEFATKFVSRDVLGQGPLLTVVRLNYMHLTPFILLDFIFSASDPADLYKCARSMAKAEVMKVVKFISLNYNNLDIVLARMRYEACLSNYKVERPDRLSARGVKRFIVEILLRSQRFHWIAIMLSSMSLVKREPRTRG